mmetsp:Transcript_33158/g.39711  ORF Transcript_33158/g.39711 Transcript_33158/m.39711 type:complete len:97 (+) Transcript_33158:2452-2742(+)
MMLAFHGKCDSLHRPQMKDQSPQLATWFKCHRRQLLGYDHAEEKAVGLRWICMGSAIRRTGRKCKIFISNLQRGHRKDLYPLLHGNKGFIFLIKLK